MADLPASIQVGPYRYRVVLDQAAIDAASREARCELTGHSNHVTQTIVLSPQLAPDALAETVLHEVLHAVLSGPVTSGLEEKAEEALVRALGYLVLDTLRRNPELVAFLLDGSGGGG